MTDQPLTSCVRCGGPVYDTRGVPLKKLCVGCEYFGEFDEWRYRAKAFAWVAVIFAAWAATLTVAYTMLRGD